MTHLKLEAIKYENEKSIDVMLETWGQPFREAIPPNQGAVNRITVRTPIGDFALWSGDWVLKDSAGRFWTAQAQIYDVIAQQIHGKGDGNG